MAPPHSYTLSFEGQGGPAGFGKGSAKVQLTPAAVGTDLSYSVQASVGGKIAQLGQRVIDGTRSRYAQRSTRPRAEVGRTEDPNAPYHDEGQAASRGRYPVRPAL
jgi:carbon monoxide dehydrogenase subunit G